MRESHLFQGENLDLYDEAGNNRIDDEVNEENDLLLSLSNNFSSAWRQVLQWRGISQAELARRTNLSEKTIGNVINKGTSGSINTLVLMCLGANLPLNISNYLLERSEHRLVPAKSDHRWYSYVLRWMYKKSIPEIQDFLQLHGAKLL